MPDFRKSYKKSKNSKNSKSGGRRRKHTMRKYRRGKKVMRGGGVITDSESLNTYLSTNQRIRTKVFQAFGVSEIDEGIPALFKQMTIKYKGSPIPTSQMVNQDGPIKNDEELKDFFSKL